VCSNFDFDEANCGDCGAPCAADERCINGLCRAEQPTCSFLPIPDAGRYDVSRRDASPYWDVSVFDAGQDDARPTADARVSDAAPATDGGYVVDAGSGGGYGFCESYWGAWALCCNGGCVDTSFDRANCGGCGISCGMGYCYYGSCDCWYPERPCNGGCMVLDTDENCGICGRACPADQYCMPLGYDMFDCVPRTDGGVIVPDAGVRPDASPVDVAAPDVGFWDASRPDLAIISRDRS
jgi:hypothetical protein